MRATPANRSRAGRRNSASSHQLSLFDVVLIEPSPVAEELREYAVSSCGGANAAEVDTSAAAPPEPVARPRRRKKAPSMRSTQASVNAASLTVDEAAAFLMLSVKTLEAWRRLGKGPRFLKLGRAVRYTKDALEAFMYARTVRNSAEGRMLDAR